MFPKPASSMRQENVLVMHARVNATPVVIVLMDSNGKYTRIGDANRVKKWLESAVQSFTLSENQVHPLKEKAGRPFLFSYHPGRSTGVLTGSLIAAGTTLQAVAIWILVRNRRRHKHAHCHPCVKRMALLEQRLTHTHGCLASCQRHAGTG
jgi:D-alanyl-D-alanine carboxypeptidase